MCCFFLSKELSTADLGKYPTLTPKVGQSLLSMFLIKMLNVVTQVTKTEPMFNHAFCCLKYVTKKEINFYITALKS